MRLALALSLASLVGCARAGMDPGGGDSCQEVECPAGGVGVRFCVSATFMSCVYRLDDGSEIQCATCGNCAGAEKKIAARCSGSPAAAKPDAGATCTSCISDAALHACATLVSACKSDTRCTQLASCVGACAPTDTKCQGQCRSGVPFAVTDELEAVGKCLADACNATCAASAPHPDGGAMGGGGTPDMASAPVTCGDCVAQAESGGCSGRYHDCVGDPDCVALGNCLDGCGNDGACADDCWYNAAPWAVDEMDALDQCLCGACANRCGGC